MKNLKLDLYGLQRTKNEFILDLFKKSKTLQAFEESLRSLNIFKTIDIKNYEGKNIKLNVEEERYKVTAGSSFDFSRSFAPYLQLKLPNLFGVGISLNFLTSTAKLLETTLSVPKLNKRGTFNFFEFCTSSYKRKNATTEFLTKSYSLNHTTTQKYSLVYEIIEGLSNILYFRVRNKTNNNFNYDLKAGCFENSLFYKLSLFFKQSFPLPLNFFYKLKTHIGLIHGHIHSSEKFYLGSNTRGYMPMSIAPLDMNEKTGGNSCIELSNSFGYRFNRLKFFIFSDFGFNSRQNDILETLKSSARSLFLKYKPASLGWSTGLGLAMNLHRHKNMAADLSVSYALPLTDTKEKKCFQFEVELDIL